LAPFFPTPTSFDTTLTLIALHPESNGYFLLLFGDYKPNKDLKLSSNSFKLTFQRMLHLSIGGLSRIVFEHLRDCFHPEDLASGFIKLFQLCFHIAQGRIPPQIAHVFGVAHLLTMTKPLGGVCPIAMGETLYQFTSCAL
jgi:hypothetical protein